MRANSFLEAVAAGHLVADGAMGTELHSRGLLYGACFEALNLHLHRPELVAEIHRSYLDAGARVIETNTFGAARTRLSLHGLGDRVRAINLAGARIARQACDAAGRETWVVGAIGPTGLVMPTDVSSLSSVERARLLDDYRAQAEALAEGGVDALLLETLRYPVELKLAVEAALGLGLPVIALATFDDTEAGPKMADGTDPETIARWLTAAGVDVLGANCGTGPRQLVEVATRMFSAAISPKNKATAPLIAMFPSAGLPSEVYGTFVHPATTDDLAAGARELFALGVHCVGGCCGTTPAHVRAMSHAATGGSLH